MYFDNGNWEFLSLAIILGVVMEKAAEGAIISLVLIHP